MEHGVPGYLACVHGLSRCLISCDPPTPSQGLGAGQGHGWARRKLARSVLGICDVRQCEAAPVWKADEPLSSVPSAGPGIHTGDGRGIGGSRAAQVFLEPQG